MNKLAQQVLGIEPSEKKDVFAQETSVGRTHSESTTSVMNVRSRTRSGSRRTRVPSLKAYPSWASARQTGAASELRTPRLISHTSTKKR